MTVAEITDGVRAYRHKPTKIQAARIEVSNIVSLAEWCGGRPYYDGPGKSTTFWIEVPTLQGKVDGSIGDYLIRGVLGEFYPVTAEVFHNAYEGEPQDT